MKIQCQDGIITLLENEVVLSKENIASLRITQVNLSIADLRARKPQFRTDATVAEVQAVADAQKAEAQCKAGEKAEQRAAWLTSKTDEELREMQRRAWDAEMTLPRDVEREMERRGLTRATDYTVDTTSDFAKWSVARAQAEREGRLDAFEDGIN